jgi:DNA-binding LacI/PurR family transcriptional regulator
MAGLRNLGIRILDASFDGFHPAEAYTPNTTSLTQDIGAVSVKVAQFLLERIDGSTEPPRLVRVPPTLKVRESCAAPPHSKH